MLIIMVVLRLKSLNSYGLKIACKNGSHLPALLLGIGCFGITWKDGKMDQQTKQPKQRHYCFGCHTYVEINGSACATSNFWHICVECQQNTCGHIVGGSKLWTKS